MLDTARMVQCIEEDIRTARKNPDYAEVALEQIRAGVALGFIRDAQAAEYVHILRWGERVERSVTEPPLHRIPERAMPGALPLAA